MSIQRVDKLPIEVILKEEETWQRRMVLIDRLLGALPSTADWNAKYPGGPPLEDHRRQLGEERDALWDKLHPKPASGRLDTMATELPNASRRRSGGPTPSARTGGLGALFRSLGKDGACTPKEGDDIVDVPPIGAFYYLDPLGTNWFSVEPQLGNPTTVVFSLTCRDPNNDPWHFGFVHAFCALYWRYELPPRIFDAEYEVSAFGYMNVTMESRANHIFGGYGFDALLSGTIGIEGSQVNPADPGLPIFHRHDWRSPRLHFESPETRLSARRMVPAGQQPLVDLMYFMHVWANRAIIEGTGSVRALDGDDLAPTPNLRCVITRP